MLERCRTQSFYLTKLLIHQSRILVASPKTGFVKQPRPISVGNGGRPVNSMNPGHLLRLWGGSPLPCLGLATHHCIAHARHTLHTAALATAVNQAAPRRLGLTGVQMGASFRRRTVREPLPCLCVCVCVCVRVCVKECVHAHRFPLKSPGWEAFSAGGRTCTVRAFLFFSVLSRRKKREGNWNHA